MFKKFFSAFLIMSTISSFALTNHSSYAAGPNHPSNLKINFDFSKATTLSSTYKAIVSAPIVPPKVDLSWNMPPVGDQGYLGSCFAFAAAYAGRTYQESKELGWGTGSKNHQFSPSFLFNQTKQLGKNPDGTSLDPNNPLSYGSIGEISLNFLKNNGCSTLDKMDYITKDGYTANYTMADINATPNPDAVNQAKRFKIKDWNYVFSLSDIKKFIAAGNPVILCLNVYPDFENMNSTTNTCFDTYIPDVNNNYGHAVTVVGYDDSTNRLKIINSWGTSWGTNGYGYISYNIFNDVFEYSLTIDQYNRISWVRTPGKAISIAYVMEDTQSEPELVTNFSQLSNTDIVTLHSTRYAPVPDYIPEISWLKYDVTNTNGSYLFTPGTVSNTSDQRGPQLDTNKVDLTNCKFMITGINSTAKSLKLNLPANVTTGYFSNFTSSGFDARNLTFGRNTSSLTFEFNSNTSLLRNSGSWKLINRNSKEFYFTIPVPNNISSKLCLSSNISLVSATAYGGDNITLRKY